MGWAIGIVVVLATMLLSYVLPLWVPIGLVLGGGAVAASFSGERHETLRLLAIAAVVAGIVVGGVKLAQMSGGGCGIDITRSGPVRDC